MNSIKKYTLETAILVIAAVLCAVVANTMAARDRKLALVGNYPNALTVPVRNEEPVPITTNQEPAATSLTPVTTTVPATPAGLSGAPAPSPAISRAPQKSAAEGGGAPLKPPSTPKTVDILALFPPHPDKPAVEINGDDVAKLYASGALFLDARRTSVYDDGHIARARSFSVWESDVDQKVAALYEERSDPAEQQQPIVIYCSGGDCEDSHMLAQKLWGLQFNNVYVYKDGFPDWQKRGGAVRRGTTP